MSAISLIRENKGLLVPAVFAIAAFGMLNTVLGSQTPQRTGTVTITQVYEDDLGSMVVEAKRPSDARVASNSDSKKHTKQGETGLQLAVGY